MRTIAVDGGNTKCKLGLLSEDLLSLEHCEEVTFDSFAEVVSCICSKQKLKTINLALTSVVQETKEFIQDFAQSSPIVKNFHYVTAKENTILDIAYNRQKLGSDRLAAAIAAYYLTKEEEIIIVDSGTATKVDMVKKGTFIGGFILPGIGIKAQALFEKTDKLPPTDVYNIQLSTCPTETAEAIQSGLILDSLGGIEKAIGICIKSVPNAKIVATGGGWDILKSFSDLTQIETIPNLALLGAGISLNLSK